MEDRKFETDQAGRINLVDKKFVNFNDVQFQESFNVMSHNSEAKL